MVRTFNLINENGQKYSLMDIKNYALLTDPEGLGVSFNTEYQQISNSFIINSDKIEQAQIGGTLSFLSYDNYASFINFVVSAKSLKMEYKVPYVSKTITYYRDVIFHSITKTEFKQGVISESVIFDATSLWYAENSVAFSGGATDNELRWDFKWDARFSDYEHRQFVYDNDAHVDSAFLLELSGYVENPYIEIYVNNVLKNKVLFNVTIDEDEKLVFCTKDTDLEYYKIDSDGNKINLFNTLDLNNSNNFPKIPIGVSRVKINSDDTEILSSKLTIYNEYIAV